MVHPLDELFNISREWVHLSRASHVAAAAVSFLRRTFQIDAGIVNYGRNPRTDGTDYLIEPKRWFTSWGLDTPAPELKQAFETFKPFLAEISQSHWFSSKDLSPAWGEIVEPNGIEQVGIWILHFQREPVGLFVLARKFKGDVDDNQDISRCMAHIAIVLEMVIARRFTEELSVRDPLTGSFNRRGLLSQFTQFASEGHPLTLAVVDLDGFKQYNDRYGHVAGDALLTNVARVLNRHAAFYQGVCGRLGGDEFILLVQNISANSWVAAQMIRKWLLNAGIQASVGCAAFGSDGENFHTCYGVADLRLYEMKIEIVDRKLAAHSIIF